jgi:hypothetical protein
MLRAACTPCGVPRQNETLDHSGTARLARARSRRCDVCVCARPRACVNRRQVALAAAAARDDHIVLCPLLRLRSPSVLSLRGGQRCPSVSIQARKQWRRVTIRTGWGHGAEPRSAEFKTERRTLRDRARRRHLCRPPQRACPSRFLTSYCL